MLYLYIVWRDMWRCQMVSHVSSVRQMGGATSSTLPAGR
nr:MAG TPA: hypothetical protein [Bacteriophage sp.]DAV71188.1 MAG TPA: hypothetical protein [Bacteriophage sp.]